MDPGPQPRGSPEPGVSPEPIDRSRSIDPLELIRLLRSAGGALVGQAVLHARLAGVEWTQEKRRLVQMLVIACVGFACLLGLMLLLAVLVLALTWDTAYRAWAVLALIGACVAGLELVRRRLRALSALGERSFAATREEIAADIELIRSRL